MKTERNKLLHLNFIFPVILLIFVSVLLVESLSYPARNKQFPQLIGGITLILLVLEIASKIIKTVAKAKDSKETAVEAPEEIRTRRKKFATLSIAMGGYVGLIFVIGHFASSVVFLLVTPFITGLNLKKDYLKVLIMVAIMTLVVYLLFVRFLQVRFIPGFLF